MTSFRISEANDQQRAFLVELLNNPEKGQPWLDLIDLSMEGFDDIRGISALIEAVGHTPELDEKLRLLTHVIAETMTIAVSNQYPYSGGGVNPVNPASALLRVDIMKYLKLGEHIPEKSQWHEPDEVHPHGHFEA